MSFDDCPICLEAMHPTDHNHPLQCMNRCNYNCCKTCIQCFIASSNDDYAEASDGNYHVKVFLRCPKCRSDLKHTIHDTLLLREVDGVLENNSGMTKPSTTTELRVKAALGHPQVQNAILEAQRVEALYLGHEPPLEHVRYEEVGVEVDWSQGVTHQESFLGVSEESTHRMDVVVDTTLFAGLEYFLSNAERFSVSDLMTSGDPAQLADAAQILFSVSLMSRHPQPLQRQGQDAASLDSSHSYRARDFSLLQLITESQKKFDKKATKEGCPISKTDKQQSEIQPSQLRKLYPLPTRSPKCVEISLMGIFDLEFVDNDWDETNVTNAYSDFLHDPYISVGRTCISFEDLSSVLFWGVQKQTKHDDSKALFPSGRSRVVMLYHTGREAAQQGARKGDVVTHIDGDSVQHKTAGELLVLLNGKKQRGRRAVLLTLNAERSIAKAYQKRAMAIANASRVAQSSSW